MTLEKLITFLTIENNNYNYNYNNYIVTFEYRVMVAAFAILAMFVRTVDFLEPGVVDIDMVEEVMVKEEEDLIH